MSVSEPPRAPVADALATLLVREGILPAERVEEAQERMVLSGGTLDTALLELGLIEEPRLLDLLPRAYNARGVGHSELDGVTKNVTTLFPRALAEKHGVVPLDISGRRLTLALAGPPDLALLDEIGFMLSVYVKPAVTTQARIASALARLYGVPVPPRLEALLPRVGVDVAAARAAVEAWQSRTSHAQAKTTSRPVVAPTATDASKPAWAQERAPDASGWSVEQNAGLSRNEASAPRLEAADGGTLAATAEARALASRRAAEPVDDAEEKRRRKRVMWTVDDAIAELALAEDRDGMLDVVMRFAYRRLGTVAAFVLVRGKDAQGAATQSFVGWDVIDPLLTKRDIAAFMLSAEPAHALGQVLQMRSPFLGPLRREDPLVRLFGRQSRAVVLVPILVGDKLIAILYGDCGTRSIPPSSLAELHMVVPRLGKGLGNLILRKKKALRAAAQPAPLEDVIVGALVEEVIARDSTDLIEIDEVEEDLAVSAPAPVRNVPTIDIDVSDIMDSAPIGAPTSLHVTPSAEAPPSLERALAVRHARGAAAVAPVAEVTAPPAPVEPAPVAAAPVAAAPVATAPVAPAPVETAPVETAPVETAPVETAPVAAAPVETAHVDAPEPRSMAWADGQADDEDVRLDDSMWRDLDNARATTFTAPIELGLDERLVAEEGAPVEGALHESAPIESALHESAPIESALHESAPIESALHESAPIKSALHESAPIESALHESAPIESAPIESAPIESAAVESARHEITAPSVIDSAPIEGAAIASASIASASIASTSIERAPIESAAIERAAIEIGAPIVGSLVDQPPPRVPGFRIDSAEGAPVASLPEPGALAPSPGSRARELLLMATHAQWMAHEDALLDELVGQLHRPGESQRRAAMAAVTSHGDRAMPSLARYFPGVLAVHPFGAMESRPEVDDLSDCVACLMKLGPDRAAPILVAELGHHDRLHRWAAVWALSGIHIAGALSRLAQRIFDAEPAIAALALEVIDGYRREAAFEKVMTQVRDLVRRGDPFERQRAIMAVGELKDREAMLPLVDLLGTRPKEIAEEARRALVEITKQDFGGAERRWKAWIADNDKTPRTRWLIDGLASKDDEIRRSAQHELNRLTGQFFGYRWDAPRTDREQSLAAWEEWWSTQKDAAPGRRQ